MNITEIWNTLDAIQTQTKFFDEIDLDYEDESVYYELCGSKTRNWITDEQKTHLLNILDDIDMYVKFHYGPLATVVDFID
jgi:hypothetical protein